MTITIELNKKDKENWGLTIFNPDKEDLKEALEALAYLFTSKDLEGITITDVK